MMEKKSIVATTCLDDDRQAGCRAPGRSELMPVRPEADLPVRVVAIGQERPFATFQQRLLQGLVDLFDQHLELFSFGRR
jgi:hypothetical protein